MTIENTQLTPVKGYDTKRIIFSDPISGVIPDSKPKIEFKRINISSRNEDGSVGELVFPTTRLFSFGVSENKSQETGRVNGYTFPLCLWHRDGASDEEKEWTSTFEKVVETCVDYLVKNKEEIDQYDLSRADLLKGKGGLNPLYWKKEKFVNEHGKSGMRVIPGTGPTLYTKLIYSKKHDKFLSQFFDQNGDTVDPLQLMNKYCYTKAAIKIESIFIGNKISLQVKLYEAVIEPTSNGMRRLLENERPVSQSKVLSVESLGFADNPLELDNDNDEDGSIIADGDDDDDKEKNDTPVVAPRKVKRTVRKAST
tara:strand:- start:6542 stop:7474 length:933 start_codon:yes stop_codon:yes gene_type:complete